MKTKPVLVMAVLLFSFFVLFLSYWASSPETAFAQTKVKIATSTSGLDFGPIWIAQRKGYFKDEGIEFEHVLTRGGAPAMAALVNGDIQFNSTAGSDVLLLRGRGSKVTALGAFPTSLDWNIAAGDVWLKKKGLTKAKVKSMSIKEKIMAMKGITLGAATVGGAPAQVVRYLLRLFNVKPDEDVKFAAVGFGPARVGALRQGQVDMIVGGIPDTEQPELEGWGVTYIRIGREVDVFKDYPHETFNVMERYLKSNEEFVRKVVRAVSRGNNLILDDPAESDRILSQHFRKIDPGVLRAAMANIRPLFRRNLVQTKSGWDNIQKVFRNIGKLKKDIDTAEGGFWTNKYLPQ